MSILIPQELIERLAAARRVAVLTGAGISAESGIPTFRDALTGLWANYDPQELATPEGFARNPKLVWEWYAERRQRIAGVQPNPGHLALAALERRFAQFTLVTQNIDSLHQRAGSDDAEAAQPAEEAVGTASGCGARGAGGRSRVVHASSLSRRGPVPLSGMTLNGP